MTFEQHARCHGMSQPTPVTKQERVRVVTWEDPLVSARQGLALGGMEYLRALAAGAVPIPPIASLIGIDGVEAEPGEVTFTAVPGEHHYNPIGMVHGGFAATLLDSAMGSAIQSTLPPGVGYSTLEIKVNYVRAMTVSTGRVRGVGRVIHAGSRVATADGSVFDEAGRLYAHGTTTCLIFRPAMTGGFRADTGELGQPD